MNPHPDDREMLSSAGDKRRREILADALAAADRRRHGRAARRVGAIVCVAGLLVGALVIMTQVYNHGGDGKTVVIERPRLPQSNPPGDGTLVANPPAPKPPAIVVQIIPANQVARPVERLDDDQLLATLADAGQSWGLVRLNGKAILVPVR